MKTLQKGCKIVKRGGGFHNSNRGWLSKAFHALRILSNFPEDSKKKLINERDEIFMNAARTAQTVGFTMDFSICDNVAIAFITMKEKFLRGY